MTLDRPTSKPVLSLIEGTGGLPVGGTGTGGLMMWGVWIRGLPFKLTDNIFLPILRECRDRFPYRSTY